jgi:hypothetical protein
MRQGATGEKKRRVGAAAGKGEEEVCTIAEGVPSRGYAHAIVPVIVGMAQFLC